MSHKHFHLFSLIFSALLSSVSFASQPQTVKTSGQVIVAFSPDGGIEKTVVSEIRRAKLRILMHAYSLTSSPIYKALIDAKSRGVDVRVLVDKEVRGNGPNDFRAAGAKMLLKNGVPLLVDEIPGTGSSHNKILLIDEGTVLTGSANASRLSETTNAENIIVFHDSPDLVRVYTENWVRRQQLSVPF